MSYIRSLMVLSIKEIIINIFFFTEQTSVQYDQFTKFSVII